MAALQPIDVEGKRRTAFTLHWSSRKAFKGCLGFICKQRDGNCETVNYMNNLWEQSPRWPNDT
jgi:hypothetical protein